MASEWRLKCPVHNDELVSDKTIPISKEGAVSQCLMFWCKRCEKYYIHTDAMAYNHQLDYNGTFVENIEKEPYDTLEALEVVCEDIKQLKSYMEPFVPHNCYKDEAPLRKVYNATFLYNKKKSFVQGLFCPKCKDLYVDEDKYDELMEEYDFELEKTTYNLHSEKKVQKYSVSSFAPSKSRKTVSQIREFLISYEECEENYKNNFPFSILHYAFMFRRFDVIAKMFNSLTMEEINTVLHISGPEQYKWITPLVCAKWNLGYIYSYDDKHDTDICGYIEPYLDEVEHIDELIEYTDEIDKNGNDVFEIFWDDVQPMLDVVFYKKQKLASQQLRKNRYSLVMDEVGTGKTVTALYAIRDIIQRKNEEHDKARILIVCPYNKREDWQNDIRRQLGRYAHIVEQGDSGLMYYGELKKAFFKNSEHIIMICGQKQGSDSEGSHSALKGSVETYSETKKWDLSIIDEAHISFDNYAGISSDMIMMLTATPIVVNSKGKRKFDDYIDLANKIVEINIVKSIEPINNALPMENDIYVNWFREDMGISSAKRKIRFVACKRWSERDEAYYQIKDDKGALAALQYDQDDEYLYMAVNEKYGYGNFHPPKANGKIDRLKSLLHESEQSFIIFCEHQFVVDRVFDVLKDEFPNDVVADKYGKYENQYGLENVQEGQLINTLMQALRIGRRVLFVTTGKTGGTGLNLGEFDGVIHYELPFTSIELEQRFGRVDRIDTRSDDKIRNMIFMLNECRNDENDMEINRMLYYCTTKIDITCQYMPIRNTVLYYPEFIKRNGKAIRESLVWFQKEYVLSEVNEKKIRGYVKKIRQYEKSIKEHEEWTYIEHLNSNMRLAALDALSNARDDRISVKYYDLLNEYLEFWKNTKSERNMYQRFYKSFREAKKNANNWLAIIGMVAIQDNSDIFVGYESSEDEEQQMINLGQEENKKLQMGRQSVQVQIKELLKLIDQSVLNDNELKNFSSEGIFCYKDNMIRRSSVSRYRSGNGWE